MGKVKKKETKNKSSVSSDNDWVTDSSEKDTDNSDDNEDENDENTTEKSNIGLADTFAKILGKKVPKGKNPVLSKGQTDQEIKIRKRQRVKETDKDNDPKKRKDEASEDEEGDVSRDPSRIRKVNNSLNLTLVI